MAFTVGAFTQATADAIDLGLAISRGLIRKAYYVFPGNGNDQNKGSADGPLGTLAEAYGRCDSGMNDAVILVSDGATSSTARVDSAFTWAKHATHLFGLCSGVTISNRARIAPTSTTTAFANFITWSGNGCRIDNVEIFHGFGTGTTSAIALTMTGGRNFVTNSHIAGMGDAASAQSTGSRCVKVSGTGENQFKNCTIGVDTVQRTVANASIEIAGGAPRNSFIDCMFPIWSSSADVLGVTILTGGADRYTDFINPRIRVFGTAITGFVKMAASGSPASVTVIENPSAVGVLTWGYDATTDAQMKIIGGVTPANGALIGLGVAPAA